MPVGATSENPHFSGVFLCPFRSSGGAAPGLGRIGAISGWPGRRSRIRLSATPFAQFEAAEEQLKL